MVPSDVLCMAAAMCTAHSQSREPKGVSPALQSHVLYFSRLQAAIEKEDTNTGANLIVDYLTAVLEGTEPEFGLGMKGKMNKFAKSYLPFLIGFNEETMLLAFAMPVVVLFACGVIMFIGWQVGDDEETPASRNKTE